ncbi:putative palmitoyl acyltransferase 1 [Trypanosoma cruzi]|nr:putative palmitoyl acyltransferase 1 [Trypanosoma cruzi]
MQVFGARMASRGGRTLPLTYFMQSELTTAEEAPPVDVFTAKLGNRTFHESLRNDSGFAIVTAFLLGGVDINVRDKNGATPLHIAVSRAAPTPGNDDDESVFLSSEGPNNLIISFLIDNGADINSRNATGETPLMIAAATQNISALRIILSRGADTSLRDDIGNTVLHHAACHPHVLQTLHSWIDDLPAQAARENLLHMVCRQGRGAEFAALFLIEQLGVDVNVREGETAATTGVHDGDHHYRPIEANTATTAAAAIQRCDSAPHSGVIVKEGLTPLHCAVLVGDTLLLRSLLLKGADVEKPDATGRTPIQLAKDCAMSSSPSLLTSLLSFIRFQCSFLGLTQRNGRTAKNIDPWKVYTILDAHCKEASSAKREANLQREAAADTSLWRLNTISDILSFGAAAALPHFLMALCALMGMPLWILIVFATIELILCNGFKVEDERRLNVRPLRCVGFLVGYTLVLLACSISLEDAMEPRRMNTRPWLFLCTIGSALCAFLVMWMNPGIVESTAGQRVGIYKTIFYSKGAPPEDVRQGIDLSCMVKKPLRAQRCRHLGRVVLRYDHYCTWLASAIGGGNHRLYIAFLLFYTVLLGICCRGTYWLSPNQMNNEMFFDDLHFRRFANVYILFVLPVAFIFSLYTLLQQLWYIARGVTAYDVAQPSCCPWCFQLGSRTYSLFDAGFWRNVCGFFFLREKFLNISYRMPVMSVRLQKMAKRHQALQLSSCHDGHCHSHENGGHGHSHNGHLGQLHQYNPQQRSNAPLNTALSNVAEGIDSPATTAVVINSSTPASALASDPFPSVAVDTTAAATQLGFEASVGRLFQLMVQHGDTDLTAVAAANEIRASVLPEKWQEIVEMAQSMYGFFKSTMNNANN